MSFEDHEHYKTWLRFKEAAGEEKQWMHQRLGWMMTAQGVLLAIYSFSNRSDTIDADFDKILKLLPFAGLVITLIGFIGVLAAAQMHLRWTFNLNKIEADVSSRSILTFGSKPHWAAQSSSLLPPTLSYFFVTIWLYLILSINMNTISMSLCNILLFILILFVIWVILLLFIVSTAKADIWSPNGTYRWKSERDQEINYVQLDNVRIQQYQACIFDFDGVICDDQEEMIFQLPEEKGERETLEEFANQFNIACVAMDINYQRHLIYQAAAYHTDTKLNKGPAFEQFIDSCNNVATFILSARSGWYAVRRLHLYIAENITSASPVETFQVGRGAKTQQVEKIMEEHDGKVIFFEDRKENIERVFKQMRNEFKHRIDFCLVQSNSRITTITSRDYYLKTVNKALDTE